MHGGRFVADVNEIDAFSERRIEYRHHVIAGQGEDLPDASTCERLHHDVSAAHPFAQDRNLLTLELSTELTPRHSP